MNAKWLLLLFILMGCVSGGTSHAAMAVIDVAAIARLASQIRTLESQLRQAQTEFQSITGTRGMHRLLSGVNRNYLPPDWNELESVMRQASARYGQLAREVEAIVSASSVLTTQRVTALSPEERDALLASRQATAVLQVTTREALGSTSARFASLQQLIDAIGTAQDQKAILDLQARIAVENTMLQNEQTKLQVIFQLAQAEELARRQRNRELAITAVGSLRRLPPIGLNN